jgi:hypothetical protein
VPGADLTLLRHWRQLLVDAWQRSQGPLAGPVHLNLPFRDPLPPTEPEKGFEGTRRAHLETFTAVPPCGVVRPTLTPATVASLLPKTDRGVVVVGPHAFEDRDESAAALRELSRLTGWPILADGAGTIRGDLAGDTSLVSAYDLILRDAKPARTLRPQAARVRRHFADQQSPPQLAQGGRHHRPAARTRRREHRPDRLALEPPRRTARAFRRGSRRARHRLTGRPGTKPSKPPPRNSRAS